MKTLWMMAIVAAAANARMPRIQATPRHTITVYVLDHRKDSNRPAIPAERCANEIFADAGVAVEWHSGRPSTAPSPTGTTFVVELVDRTPGSYMKNAMAFALPFEGVHIRVFFDRVQGMDPMFPDAVLAHVLTHEITHLLQALDRHSQTGVMKAHYTRADVYAMRTKPMSFAKQDVVLIELGIAKRLGTEPNLADVPVEAALGNVQ